MSTTSLDILTPEQAADYLQVNRETIYRYIRSGKLSASRLGRDYRIPRRSLDHLLAVNQVRPDIPLREYSDQQLAEFLEADRLDDDTRELVRRFRERIDASHA